jgi:hypothetical protein
MINNIRRRLSRVEESIPVPITAERFYSLACQHAKRTGGSVESAVAVLAKNLSDSDLDSVASEFERIAFGDDIAARDAAKQQFLDSLPKNCWFEHDDYGTTPGLSNLDKRGHQMRERN